MAKIYNAEGSEVVVETPPPYIVNAKNYGYVNDSNSFFGKEVSASGVSEKFIVLNGSPFTNDHIGDHKIYVSVKVRCTADCHIRLFSGTISQSIIDATPRTSYAYYTQKVEGTLAEIDIVANTDYYISGCIKKTVTSTGISKQIQVVAEFDSVEDAVAATLTANYGVCIEQTEVFGAGYELDARAMDILMSAFENRYFSTETNLITDKVIRAVKSQSALLERVYSPYVRETDDGNVEFGGAINEDWAGWQYVQWAYGNNPKLCPVPAMVHGKIHTDALFSAVPILGNWGREAVTTGANNWGGHVFHGWNDAMTYRLTMMASGGMTNSDNREDEFCIHAFSPTNAYDNPIGLTPEEAENRVQRDIEDIFSGGAYYGRVRIGADKGDEGFVFRSKSLTCYGRLDMNGNKFILGDQATNVPANSSSSGKKGQIAYDSNYMYVCVADNTWKRIALETF